MAYPFRQGIDYGPRSGTRGISWHMAEGGDGTLGWLARRAGETTTEWRTRVRGVSCHVVILSDGTIWQMLGWDRACGNLNPADRAGEYGYYGHHHLVDVLGGGWTNPNEWTLSAEITGFRADGPTAKQRDAAIRWGNEMKARFPSIRGATGHHDQSPKGCPGLKPNMKAIFTGLGGHGRWSDTQTPEPVEEPDVPGTAYRIISPAVGKVTVRSDPTVDGLIVPSDGRVVEAPDGSVRECFAEVELLKAFGTHAAGSPGYLVGRLLEPTAEVENFEAAILLKFAGVFAPTAPPAADCTNAVAAELERAAVRAADAVRAA